MKLCLATMILQIKERSEINKTKICKDMFLGIDPSYNIKGVESKITEFTSGKRGVTKSSFNGFDRIESGEALAEVAKRYHGTLSKDVLVDKRGAFVETILGVIADEIYELSSIQLYYKDKEIEWNDFLTLDFYDFDHFLAAMCRVVIMRGKILGGGEGEVGDSLRLYRSKPVLLVGDVDKLQGMDQDWTIKNLDFHQYFNCVPGDYQNTIYQESNKPSDLRFFYLSPDCGHFNKAKLVDMLEEVATSYVFSNSFIENKDRAGLGIKAFKKISEGSSDDGDELRDILSYVFSEKCIPAPKLLTFIQMQSDTSAYQTRRGSSKVFHSRGIHFVAYKSAIDGKEYIQYIFTISAIQDDLDDSIDQAVETMGTMLNPAGTLSGMTRELKFVGTQNDALGASEDIAKDIKASILPSKEGRPRTDMGFSVFLGFKMDSPSIVGLMDVGEYEVYVVQRLQQYLQRTMESIRKKLQDAGITQSVYFYFLPFEDPVRDKKEVMDAFLMR